MSTIPGYELEDYIMWEFNLVVKGRADANLSLQIAETIGTASHRRQVLDEDQFQKIMEVVEPYRDDIEYWLGEYDEETQSWRDYAGFSTDRIPSHVIKLINQQLEERA